jgi:N-acetyltransferase
MDAFVRKGGGAARAKSSMSSATPSANGSGWQRLFGSAGPSQRSRPAVVTAGLQKKRKERVCRSGLEQTYLDLGQKSFGRTVECRICGFIYAEGEATDEAEHRKHHRRSLMGVHVRGGLAELRVVCDDREDGDRIVALHDTDGPDAVRKIAEVKALLDAELGHTPDLAQGVRAFLFLEAHSGRLRGFALVEPRVAAFRAVPPELHLPAEGGGSSDAAHREGHNEGDARVLLHDGVEAGAMAGISHIWTDPKDRRRGVARALLDAVRKRFATGFELPRNQLAFSQPTSLGRRLAAAYSYTERFLVYS